MQNLIAQYIQKLPDLFVKKYLKGDKKWTMAEQNHKKMEVISKIYKTL